MALSNKTWRTDRHNNPAALITELAKQSGLTLGVHYSVGDSFKVPTADPQKSLTLYTARLIGDPIMLTIRVITHVTYFTHTHSPRWTYLAIPPNDWDMMSLDTKRDVIGYHYKREGGMALRRLFPNYDTFHPVRYVIG